MMGCELSDAINSISTRPPLLINATPNLVKAFARVKHAAQWTTLRQSVIPLDYGTF